MQPEEERTINLKMAAGNILIQLLGHIHPSSDAWTYLRNIENAKEIKLTKADHLPKNK